MCCYFLSVLYYNNLVLYRNQRIFMYEKKESIMKCRSLFIVVGVSILFVPQQGLSDNSPSKEKSSKKCFLQETEIASNWRAKFHLNNKYTQKTILYGLEALVSRAPYFKGEVKSWYPLVASASFASTIKNVVKNLEKDDRVDDSFKNTVGEVIGEHLCYITVKVLTKYIFEFDSVKNMSFISQDREGSGVSMALDSVCNYFVMAPLIDCFFSNKLTEKKKNATPKKE